MDEIVIALMSGPQDGAILSFETVAEGDEPTELTIGRREGCDICLHYDSQVSREHAVLSLEKDTFWLEDTNSTNGTFVGDKKITGRVSIQPGELFRIGRTWMRVEVIGNLAALESSDDDLPF